MNAIVMKLAALRRRAELAAGVVAVLGSAVLFFPAWRGGWSHANVVTWLTAFGAMSLIVWLYVLAKCLARDGHGIHSAIVFGLILPVLGVATRLIGGQRSFAIASVDDALRLSYGGAFNVFVVAALVLAAVLHAVGLMPSPLLFPKFDAERRRAR